MIRNVFFALALSGATFSSAEEKGKLTKLASPYPTFQEVLEQMPEFKAGVKLVMQKQQAGQDSAVVMPRTTTPTQGYAMLTFFKGYSCAAPQTYAVGLAADTCVHYPGGTVGYKIEFDSGEFCG